ncbi:MAG: hypothetical protein HC842_03755 [Cytophagales bacterium]|nr:hypothetical protein [Cytophagales bacterium]
MVLSTIGQVAQEQWLASADMRKDMGLEIGSFVVMPNHFHGLILIGNDLHVPGQSYLNSGSGIFGTQSNNLAAIIRGFKGAVTSRAKALMLDFAWQPRYHDRVVRSEKELYSISHYIENNPANWPQDEYNHHKKMDLNCDLGENEAGLSLEASIIPFLGSCNIACGAHAGTEQSMRQVMRLAQRHGVLVGAHPGYADPNRFGRVSLNLSPRAWRQTLDTQLAAFAALAEAEGVGVHHVKLHGAMYHDAHHSIDYAQEFLTSMRHHWPHARVYGMPRSLLERQCLQMGIEFWPEAFADRRYEPDLSLRTRQYQDAVLTLADALAQAKNLLFYGKVEVVGGLYRPLLARTLCIHGDQPYALELAKGVQELIHRHVA